MNRDTLPAITVLLLASELALTEIGERVTSHSMPGESLCPQPPPDEHDTHVESITRLFEDSQRVSANVNDVTIDLGGQTIYSAIAGVPRPLPR